MFLNILFNQYTFFIYFNHNIPFNCFYYSSKQFNHNCIIFNKSSNYLNYFSKLCCLIHIIFDIPLNFQNFFKYSYSQYHIIFDKPLNYHFFKYSYSLYRIYFCINSYLQSINNNYYHNCINPRLLQYDLQILLLLYYYHC